jgi:hypothetical protein
MLLILVSVIVSSAICAVAVGDLDETKSKNKIQAANCKFFEVKSPRSDNYWNFKIDVTKSRRDHFVGVKKASTKSKGCLRVAKPVAKMS